MTEKMWNLGCPEHCCSHRDFQAAGNHGWSDLTVFYTYSDYRAGKHMHTTTNPSLVPLLVPDVFKENDLPKTAVNLNSYEGRRRPIISCALRAEQAEQNFLFIHGI